MKRKSGIILGVAVGAPVLLVLLPFFLYGLVSFVLPPLRIEDTSAGVTVHVETLGEYPTTVSRIRIEEAASGIVVFEAASTGRAPQLWNFELVAGSNLTSAIDPDQVFTIVRPQSATFFLRPGQSYRVTVWNGGWFSSSAHLRFAG